MRGGYLSGIIKFSFHTAVEIAKLNAYRISCVWQMLTTHLKMLASTKVLYCFNVNIVITMLMWFRLVL